MNTLCDILYVDRGRAEFSFAALAALKQNTNARLAGECIQMTDAQHPVEAMRWYLTKPRSGAALFAKIDNDTIVPPGWLDACLEVMTACPELDLLGIEPPQSRTGAPGGAAEAKPEYAGTWNYYAPAAYVGGIGVFRRSAFERFPDLFEQDSYGGFTQWQWRHPEIRKGWILPSLKVFLLDRLPVEPWASLSKEYIRQGVQRPWTNYDPADHALWDWWLLHA